jgi:hypothetical protein
LPSSHVQEAAKKAKRAERFGAGPAVGDEEAEKRRKRAARFAGSSEGAEASATGDAQ